MICVVLVQRFGFHCLVVAFFGGWVIQTTKHIQSRHQVKCTVVSMLQNWSYMYYSHHRIIKCVGFKLICCAINLNVVSFSRIFSEFDSSFQ